ncbi:hypothetical protein EG829_30770 [bacterium]|nr:hypothetical protein [bacterium]
MAKRNERGPDWSRTLGLCLRAGQRKPTGEAQAASASAILDLTIELLQPDGHSWIYVKLFIPPRSLRNAVILIVENR